MFWADAVLMFVCLVAGMMFVLGLMRYPSRARKTTRGLGSYVFPDDAGRLASGIVGTLAVRSATEPLDAGHLASGVLGLVMGILSASLPEKLLKPTLGFFGVLGLIGLVVALGGFANDSGCTGVGLERRLFVLVVLASSALVGALVATMQGRLRSAAPLALFATLDILVFLEEPLGVPLFGQGWGRTLVPVMVAALLGYGGAVMPAVVIGLGALGVGFAAILASAGYGTMCSATPDFAPLVMLVLYGIGFVVTTKFLGRRV